MDRAIIDPHVAGRVVEPGKRVLHPVLVIAMGKVFRGRSQLAFASCSRRGSVHPFHDRAAGCVSDLAEPGPARDRRVIQSNSDEEKDSQTANDNIYQPHNLFDNLQAQRELIEY